MVQAQLDALKSSSSFKVKVECSAPGLPSNSLKVHPKSKEYQKDLETEYAERERQRETFVRYHNMY
jgi:hypothetical protein